MLPEKNRRTGDSKAAEVTGDRATSRIKNNEIDTSCLSIKK